MKGKGKAKTVKRSRQDDELIDVGGPLHPPKKLKTGFSKAEGIARSSRTPAMKNEAASSSNSSPMASSNGEETESVTSWLKSNGIPVSNRRQLKLHSTKYISASNVTAGELKEKLEWSFYNYDFFMSAKSLQEHGREISAEIAAIHTLSIVEELEDYLPLFYIPREWEDSKKYEEFQNSETTWLQFFLALRESSKIIRECVHFMPQDPEDRKNGVPCVDLMEGHKLSTSTAPYSLIHFFISPNFQSGQIAKSEEEVERLIGAILGAFFNVQDCTTTSNITLKFPNEITAFGSQPKPDYAARIKKGYIAGIPGSLYPATSLGEAKLKESGLMKGQDTILSSEHQEAESAASGVPRIVAQLAFEAYPSLIVILAALINKWRESPPTEYQVPKHVLIYGVGYSAHSVIICAFFPYIHEWHDNGFPRKWKFASVTVTSEFQGVFMEENIEKRLRLAAVLLRLQQHATELKDHMELEKLPQIFKEVVE